MRGEGKKEELWEGAEGLGEGDAVEELAAMLCPVREEFLICLWGQGL